MLVAKLKKKDSALKIVANVNRQLYQQQLLSSTCDRAIPYCQWTPPTSGRENKSYR